MILTTTAYLKEECYHGNLKKAISYFLQHKKDIFTLTQGTYKIRSEFFYMIQEYETKDSTIWEAHKKYIDIQIILSGEELIEVAIIDKLQSLDKYDKEKDFLGFEGPATSFLEMQENDLVILFPEDAHKPALTLKKGKSFVKKCLFKVLI